MRTGGIAALPESEPPQVTILAPGATDWPATVDHLHQLVGAPRNLYLLPPHFLKVTLPRIGGRQALFSTGGKLATAGFLLPQGLEMGVPSYVLRVHVLHEEDETDLPALARAAERHLPGYRVHPYDPLGRHRYAPTFERQPDGLSIGRPTEDEAAAIRGLYARIWGSDPQFLYPPDIHGVDFHCAHTLVARVDGELAGFLFGFFRLDLAPLPAAWQPHVDGRLRIESQAMGVLPAFRGRGVATALKQAQAAYARRRGIDLIHWTADPLQSTNAMLNFGRLRAVAWDFYPDYYPFRNVLNQVPASRVHVTWPVNSRRVLDAAGGPAGPDRLGRRGRSGVAFANQGYRHHRLDLTAPAIAFQVPSDWTGLQAQARPDALHWRQVNDELLEHYLGIEPGKYVLTGVGEDGPTRFLIGRRVTRALLEQLATP